ncbi:MAG: polynucleotide adenylyltransferase PcnB [Desulfobacterota bacterium]|jgi:poly(A) polymerase|nr:polynucleotide adenylyltransferase PcnB [Thermodesulfobacteriota bacterium]
MNQTREPNILPRSSHTISRRDIDPEALKVLYRLARNGHKAYLVGGAVRDLLLGKRPKDFDVATDARPGQIKKLFANCFLIGRRFRLAHIHFRGGKIIEVATFRKDPDPSEEIQTDPHNTFGSPVEDAFRRDITINGLFYDINSFSIIDYVGGLGDISRRRVCIIGEPSARYAEDPVRMWRVLRYAASNGFSIEERTAGAIAGNLHLLASCSGSRMYEEFNKDLYSGSSAEIFSLLMRHSLFSVLFGNVGRVLERQVEVNDELSRLLAVHDRLVLSGNTPSPSVSYSLLLWPWARIVMRDKGQPDSDKMKLLADELAASGMSMIIPKGIRASAVHVLEILDRMMQALETGRMRWSLLKKASYKDAVFVFSLVTQGRLTQGEDAFRAAYTAQHPDKTDKANPRKRRRRRRFRKRAPGAGHQAAGQEASRIP